MKSSWLVGLLALTACGGNSDNPAPAPAPPAVAKTHTVELSYLLRPFSNASQLPAEPPVITLAVRAVQPQAGGGFAYLPDQPLMEIKDVSATVKKVRLPDVATYAGAPPVVLVSTVTVKEPQAQYEVEGFYTVDGVMGYYTVAGAYIGTPRAVHYHFIFADEQGTPLSERVEYKIFH